MGPVTDDLPHRSRFQTHDPPAITGHQNSAAGLPDRGQDGLGHGAGDGHLTATNRGLLPGSPAITQTGLTPVGLVQFSGRNMRVQARALDKSRPD